MAVYEISLLVPAPVDHAFDFVSEFSNAAHWDPRTYAAEKTTEGAVGVGTVFTLTGGLLKESWVTRLRIPRRIAGMPLPYEVESFDPNRSFVLVGQTWLVRYRDVITFDDLGDQTRVHYWASLELRGLLRLLDPILRPMFKRIGDDATRDLPATVAGSS